MSEDSDWGDPEVRYAAIEWLEEKAWHRGYKVGYRLAKSTLIVLWLILPVQVVILASEIARYIWE